MPDARTSSRFHLAWRLALVAVVVYLGEDLGVAALHLRRALMLGA